MVERGDRFDLAILDMHMPGMDGVELAHRLRDLRPELPLVLYTSLGGGDELDPVFAAVLAKPVKQSQLFDVLVSLLERRHDRAAAVDEDSAATSPLGERHPLRILLAEDNTVNQQIALLLLESMGYRADVAIERRRGGRGGAPAAVRPGAHGRADARDGRPRGDPAIRAGAPGDPAAHRRDDRERDAGRS